MSVIDPQPDPPEGLPAGGTTGQVLAKTGDGDGEAGWVDPESAGSGFPLIADVSADGHAIDDLSVVRGNGTNSYVQLDGNLLNLQGGAGQADAGAYADVDAAEVWARAGVGQPLARLAADADGPKLDLGAAPPLIGSDSTPWSGKPGLLLAFPEADDASVALELSTGDVVDFDDPGASLSFKTNAVSDSGTAEVNAYSHDGVGGDSTATLSARVDYARLHLGRDTSEANLLVPEGGDPSLQLGPAPLLKGVANPPYGSAPALLIESEPGQGAKLELHSDDDSDANVALLAGELSGDYTALELRAAGANLSTSPYVYLERYILGAYTDLLLDINSAGDAALRLGGAPALVGAQNTPYDGKRGLVLGHATEAAIEVWAGDQSFGGDYAAVVTSTDADAGTAKLMVDAGGPNVNVLVDRDTALASLHAGPSTLLRLHRAGGAEAVGSDLQAAPSTVKALADELVKLGAIASHTVGERGPLSIADYNAVYGTGITAYDQEFDRVDSSSLPTGWSWFNQGSASYAERFGAGGMVIPSAGANIRGIVRSLPSESTWFADLFLSSSVASKVSGNAVLYGIILRQSADAKCVGFWVGSQNGFIISRSDNNSLTNLSNYTTGVETEASGVICLRLKRNSATSFDFYASADGGVSWTAVDLARNYTGHLSGTVDQIGVVTYNNTGVAISTAAHAFRVR